MIMGQPEKETIPKKSHRIWPDWYSKLQPYQVPKSSNAIWQLMNTLILYGCLWAIMIQLIHMDYPIFFIWILSVPAGFFLVRIFILFHDCVHGCFFKSKRINTGLGYLLGVLAFTSFEDWRFCHLRHHAKYANLDTRGFGDIWTLTREEYETSTKSAKLMYRLYRNPFVLIGLGALFNFLLHNRLPSRKVKHKERMGVVLTNLLIIAIFLAASRAIGWRTYVLIQMPVLWVAGAAGIWLFYVQHQFEGGYWARNGAWDPLRAAMEGSSFYQLPHVLRWFSGNIGYHHVHHLNPNIPNYFLKYCYDNVPELQQKEPLTLIKSLSCIRMKLWDEKGQKMTGFN
ncbi:MAG: fatty acid desaturase [Desulfobacula sp.]|nr:fatty acid desaturase [Desulfobacula sp.]